MEKGIGFKATRVSWIQAESTVLLDRSPANQSAQVQFLAMHLPSKAKTNVSALELMRDLGVSYLGAWLVKQELMETMRLREEPRQLSGRVEIDDS